MIPLSVPSIQGNEWKYVKECLDSEWVSSAGKYVDLFEEKTAEYTGSKYAIACINGTSALHVCLRVSGVKSGDEVIVPTLTFIAPVNAICYAGGTPVFMDVDEHYNIDMEKTIEFIREETIFTGGNTYNKRTNARIAAIIPVHVFGNAAWFDELVPFCKDRNIVVIEDATESLGTIYKDGKFSGKHTGTVGQLGCLSFNGNKIITTGGGGMILTNEPEFAEKVKYLTTQAKDDEVRYIHNEIGYNFRLSNIQAALGVAQLEQLPAFLRQKKKIYAQYADGLKTIDGLTLAGVPDYSDNNHWMSILQIELSIYGRDREMLMSDLKDKAIETRPVWYLNHLQKPYRNCQAYKIERAEKLVEMSLLLPSSSNLDREQISKVLGELKNA